MKAAIVRGVDAVLAGESSGAIGGWWALLVDDAPGGVGYSGKGAGADEIGKPVLSPQEVYAALVLTLPMPPDPYEAARLRELVYLAHVGAFEDILRQHHRDTFVELEDGGGAAAGQAVGASSGARGRLMAWTDRQAAGAGARQSEEDGDLGRRLSWRRTEGALLLANAAAADGGPALSSGEPSLDVNVLLNQGSADSFGGSMELYSLEDSADEGSALDAAGMRPTQPARHRRGKKHRRGKVSRKDLLAAAEHPAQFSSSVASMRVFISHLGTMLTAGRPEDTSATVSSVQSSISSELFLEDSTDQEVGIVVPAGRPSMLTSGAAATAPKANKAKHEQLSNPTLRRMFNVFDVEQRGMLDLEQLALLLTEMCVPLDPSDILDMAEDQADAEAVARRNARRKAYQEARELRHMQRHIDAEKRYLRRKEARWLRRMWRSRVRAEGATWYSKADHRAAYDELRLAARDEAAVRRMERWRLQAYDEQVGIALAWEEQGMARRPLRAFSECVLGPRDRLFTDDESEGGGDSHADSASTAGSYYPSGSMGDSQILPAGHARRRYSSSGNRSGGSARVGRWRVLSGSSGLPVQVWEVPPLQSRSARSGTRSRSGSVDSTGSRPPLPSTRSAPAAQWSQAGERPDYSPIPMLRPRSALIVQSSVVSPTNRSHGGGSARHTSRVRQLREVTQLGQGRLRSDSFDSNQDDVGYEPESPLPSSRRYDGGAMTALHHMVTPVRTPGGSQPVSARVSGDGRGDAVNPDGIFSGLHLVSHTGGAGGPDPFEAGLPRHETADGGVEFNDGDGVSEHDTDSSGDRVSDVRRSESPSSDSTEDDQWRGRRRDFRMYVTWEQFHAAIRALTKKRSLESLMDALLRNFDRVRASTRRFASRQLGDMYDVLTHRAILWREHKRTVVQARARFRRKHKPWFACDRCIQTFSFPSEWKAHVKVGCRPKHVRAMVEALQFRTRWDDVPAHFEFEHPQGAGAKIFVPVTKHGRIAAVA